MPVTDGPTIVDLNLLTKPVYKQGFVIGSDSQWIRDLTNMLAGDTPISAWLTIKGSPAQSDASGLQSIIGLAATGFGLIVANRLTINVLSQDTLQLHPGPLYYYDIKVQMTPSGKVYVCEQGFIEWLPEVGDKPIPVNGSVSLPPLVPSVLVGTNPPPPGTFQVGTRYWVVPPVPGFPSTWVYANDLAWHVESVVNY